MTERDGDVIADEWNPGRLRPAGGGPTSPATRARYGVRREFDRIGWQWGGRYSEPDFQHFSTPGDS